jgi:hypothetical protein
MSRFYSSTIYSSVVASEWKRTVSTLFMAIAHPKGAVLQWELVKLRKFFFWLYCFPSYTAWNRLRG